MRAVARLGAAAARTVSRRHDPGAARPAAGRLAADPQGGIGDADFVAANQGDAGACAGPACRRRDRPAEAFFRPQGERRGRVALLQGCAQQVLAPRINQAAINLLTRHGIEVVLVKDEQCCGALTHHLGRDGDALARARANIDVWLGEAERDGLDAILVTTSGCGTVIKDYGYMLREDRDFAGPAAKVSALAKDITEYVGGIELQPAQQHGDIVDRLSLGLFAAARTENHASLRKNCFPRTDSW